MTVQLYHLTLILNLPLPLLLPLPLPCLQPHFDSKLNLLEWMFTWNCLMTFNVHALVFELVRSSD